MKKLFLTFLSLLGLVLGAHGQPQDWNYVGDRFSPTEHIVYVGLTDSEGNALSLHTDADWIGAFIDGECRGAAMAASSQQQSGSICYFPLRIKGTEADNGKTVSFRYYQQSGNNALEFDLAAAQALTYANEQTTGTLSALFTLPFTQPLYFTFPQTLEVRVGETLNLMDQFTWQPADATRPVRIDWDWANSMQYIKVENDVLTALAPTDGTYLGFSCLREIKSTDGNYSTTVKVVPGLTGFTFEDVAMGRNSLHSLALTPVPADATVDADKVTVRIKSQELPEGWTLATADRVGSTGLQWTITPQAIGYGTIEVLYDGTLMAEHVLTIGQSFTQKEGWQWITPYGGYADIPYIYGDALQEMRSQTKVVYNDPVYGYFGELSYLEPRQCYKACVKEGQNVDAFNLKADYSPDDFEIQLAEKWNWIGFNYQFAHPLADALTANAAPASGDRIVSKDRGFAEYDGTSWEGTLTVLAPGEGYLYYNASGQENTLRPVSERTLGQPSASSASQVQRLRSGLWQYNSAPFAGNMTIIADLGSRYSDHRYSVGAFIGQECRGEGNCSGGLWFITVHGDTHVKGQTVTLRVHDRLTGAECSVDGLLPFTQMAGSLRAPVRMNVTTPTGIGSVQDDAIHANVRYYTVDGRLVDGKPSSGVYIVSDGKTTRKVVIR